MYGSIQGSVDSQSICSLPEDLGNWNNKTDDTKV
jgi:hypothetical protein